MTKLNYSGAEFIDLMGVKRKPAKDGTFAVSSFPLFIRGKKGDFGKFTKAVASSVLDDPDRLPCHIGFSIMPGNQVKLTLVNHVARELKGTLKIFGKEHAFKIPRTGETSLMIDLPKPIRFDRVEAIPVPYICRIGSQTFSKRLDLFCFGVKKFTGDWSKIPAVRLVNKAGMPRWSASSGRRGRNSGAAPARGCSPRDRRSRHKAYPDATFRTRRRALLRVSTGSVR